MLLPCAGSIVDADARLAARLTADVLRAAVSRIPSGWADGERYLDYLTRRLAPPRAFAAEAEEARP